MKQKRQEGLLLINSLSKQMFYQEEHNNDEHHTTRQDHHLAPICTHETMCQVNKCEDKNLCIEKSLPTTNTDHGSKKWEV